VPSFANDGRRTLPVSLRLSIGKAALHTER
jgi:hypothetical protein